jgi:hypothetical protein
MAHRIAATQAAFSIVNLRAPRKCLNGGQLFLIPRLHAEISSPFQPNSDRRNVVPLGEFAVEMRAAHSFVVRSLSELAITETGLKLIAAAAILGFRSSPNVGKSTPAASVVSRKYVNKDVRYFAG